LRHAGRPDTFPPPQVFVRLGCKLAKRGVRLPAGEATDVRVLIVADHASAQFGGEAILPLHYFRGLRRRGVETWLIVHGRTRAELAERFASDLHRIHFIPDTRLHRLLDRVGRRLPRMAKHFTAGWLLRLLTQVAARRVARRLVRELQIDVVHQPIPVSPRESSVLYGLGAPVIIGPMNGGMIYPPGFGRSQTGGGTPFMSTARRLSELVHRALPGKLRADVLLVANERTRRALPGAIRGKVITLAENGVDLSLWEPRTPTADDGQPVRFVFSGRLDDWKGADMLIEAFSGLVAQVPATLDIIGDGQEHAKLEQMIARLGLAESVKLLGWRPQGEAARIIRDSDVFVLPSIYECGGAVVLEAMASGLPVIAADWGGPADYLDEASGVLVPLRNRHQLIADLREAMLRLARSPKLRRQMGQAGRQRVLESYDWERKVEQMLDIYRQTAARWREHHG
jgi:glycosyltransferase involved in cell wall biosynthesis